MWLRVAFQYSILLCNDRVLRLMFTGEHTKEKEKITGGKKNGAELQRERQLKINKNAT